MVIGSVITTPKISICGLKVRPDYSGAADIISPAHEMLFFAYAHEFENRQLGESYCTVEHVGMVVSGCATAAFADGRVTQMNPGDVFYVPPEPHDSWVVGDEPYVSLHFLGAGRYAK